MSVTRKNTVVVDFGVLPVRPDAAKVQQFLEKEIQLQLSEVENIQLHNVKNCVYIEVKDSKIAARYQEKHNNKHVIVHRDKGFKIPVFVESDAVPVRVHDLPPAMTHVTVIQFLKQYGDVISITRERWKNYFPGVYNGVRILHMNIKKPIPSYVIISGHQTLITHPGQTKTCKQCHKVCHPGQKCAATATNNIVIATDTPQTVLSCSEKCSILNPEDFPPIERPPKQQQAVTNVLTTIIDDQTATRDDDLTDDDGNESSSSGTVETTKKRRRSARLANERKKLCSSQASLNGHLIIQSGLQDSDTALFSDTQSPKVNELISKDLNCNTNNK